MVSEDGGLLQAAKKYRVTINDLLEENKKLEERAKAGESGKMKEKMERAQQDDDKLLNTLIEKILVQEAVKGEDGSRKQEEICRI